MASDVPVPSDTCCSEQVVGEGLTQPGGPCGGPIFPFLVGTGLMSWLPGQVGVAGGSERTGCDASRPDVEIVPHRQPFPRGPVHWLEGGPWVPGSLVTARREAAC